VNGLELQLENSALDFHLTNAVKLQAMHFVMDASHQRRAREQRV
jgi:hypothetical protein